VTSLDQSSTVLNTDALTEPVRPHLVRAHASRLQRGRPSTVGNTLATGLLGCIALVAVVLFGVLLTNAARLPGGVPIALAVLVLVLAGVVFLWWKLRRRLRADREGRYRLQNFAAVNNMTYHDQVSDPGHPGMIFSIGGERIATNVLRTSSAPLVEFGHYQYLSRAGKQVMIHQWGYVAITLDTALPHIVLDAVGNNSILGSGMPTSYGAAQRLSLEGDFDRYFDLYCPEGYERDALYLFSPDVMARFVDTVAVFDIEIVDNTLFLYTGPAVVTLSPSMWVWLLETVTALNTKIARWERWRDERKPEPPQTVAQAAAPPNPALKPGVAIEGQRLRPRQRGVWIVVGAIAFGLIGYILQTV
jgi:hypothetical protein